MGSKRNELRDGIVFLQESRMRGARREISRLGLLLWSVIYNLKVAEP